MDDSDSTTRRLLFATERVLGRSVMAMPRADWESLIREDGAPTRVSSLGSPFQGVMHDAEIVAVAASGYHNRDPGIDFVRLDERDAPYIHNIDHYTVCQTLTLHNDYAQIIKVAGIDDSPELQKCLYDFVFIVKRTPEEIDDHWCVELPERIKSAREK